MQGVYKVGDDIATVTTATPLLFLKAAADRCIEILSARVTCVDEPTSEQFQCKLTIPSGTEAGGDTVTPHPMGADSAPADSTALSDATAITGLTGGDIEAAFAGHAANKLGGWEYVPLPEERPMIKGAQELLLETTTTITSCTLHAEIVFREL